VAVITAIAMIVSRTTTPTLPRGTGTAVAPNAVVPSIGVLPFANRSDNRAMEYFSDGVTDELISALSRVNGLEVAGRTSSFSLKGKGLDVTESASRLKVAYVIDGSVRKNGSTVRVTWQLIDGKTGRGIGSGDVDGEMRNVIALQDSLARSIVAKLGPVLGNAATPAAPRHTTANFEAYDLYLKGHYFWNQRTPAAMRSGIAYLKDAISKDPNYALAYAELASAYTLQPGFGDARPADVMGPARAAARRAFALDSTLSESYTALGISSMFNDWQWTMALEYLDRAIALDPKNSFPRLFRAWPLVMLGRMDEAIVELRKARDLDPLSAIINTRVGSVYTYAGRYDEAIVELRKVVTADPSNLLARFSLARALLYKGQYTDAIKEAPDAIDVAAGYEIGTVALAYGLSGRKDEALAVQQRLQARSRERYITSEAMVIAALAVDDKPRALSWLERGLREHSFYLPFIGVERLYDPIRDDPRFKEVLRKIGL
jgi:TolB-like protein/Flp pilus assembly protein TadD